MPINWEYILDGAGGTEEILHYWFGKKEEPKEEVTKDEKVPNETTEVSEGEDEESSGASHAEDLTNEVEKSKSRKDKRQDVDVREVKSSSRSPRQGSSDREDRYASDREDRYAAGREREERYAAERRREERYFEERDREDRYLADRERAERLHHGDRHHDDRVHAERERAHRGHPEDRYPEDRAYAEREREYRYREEREREDRYYAEREREARMDAHREEASRYVARRVRESARESSRLDLERERSSFFSQNSYRSSSASESTAPEIRAEREAIVEKRRISDEVYKRKRSEAQRNYTSVSPPKTAMDIINDMWNIATLEDPAAAGVATKYESFNDAKGDDTEAQDSAIAHRTVKQAIQDKDAKKLQDALAMAKKMNIPEAEFYQYEAAIHEILADSKDVFSPPHRASDQVLEDPKLQVESDVEAVSVGAEAEAEAEVKADDDVVGSLYVTPVEQSKKTEFSTDSAERPCDTVLLGEAEGIAFPARGTSSDAEDKAAAQASDKEETVDENAVKRFVSLNSEATLGSGKPE